MRRKAGTLLPLEKNILRAAVVNGGEVYGYLLSKGSGGRETLAANGTIYRALRRLTKLGLLTSRWETKTGRPRKLYSITEEGREAIKP